MESKAVEFAKQAFEGILNGVGKTAEMAGKAAEAVYGNEHVQNRTMHGASELANALYNGSAFQPYGYNVKMPEHEHDKGQQQGHEQGHQQQHDQGISR